MFQFLLLEAEMFVDYKMSLKMYRMAAAHQWTDMMEMCRDIIMSSENVTPEELQSIASVALKAADDKLYNFWALKQGRASKLLWMYEE